jgi:[ribosomal protein S18]-alanine N-acetyltransferase
VKTDPSAKQNSGRMAEQAIQESNIHIRWMIRRDMPTVLAIESECFEFSWSEDDFIRCLRQRNCIGMVAEVDSKVVGFMIYELHKNRLHILNFAVAESARRKGVGKSMVAKLLGKLSHERRNRIMLEIRETNLEAQLFFKNIGFKAISVLRDFYEDTDEDAYLMQFRYRPTAEELAHPHNRISKMAG